MESVGLKTILLVYVAARSVTHAAVEVHTLF